jgi:hypothetical protein
MRRNAISDAFINYLAAMMLKGYYERRATARLPGSLVVLAWHQLCGQNPDLGKEGRSREARYMVGFSIGRQLEPDETLSVRKLAIMANRPRSTAARLLLDKHFNDGLERGRKANEQS